MKKEEDKQYSQEWSIKKNYNPYNSIKILAHIDRWKLIKKGGQLPPPVLVTIDPANTCNFNCVWCNSKPVTIKKVKYLSPVALQRIIEILKNWSCPNTKYKVNSVCIAGGGEPLLNNNTGFLIDKLTQESIDVGVITNGTYINKFIKSLSRCHWVSVSIDSGTAETFSKLKNAHPSQFHRVINNIQLLIKYSNENNALLASSPLSFGVTYKFLIHRDNINEIESAAKIAKAIGCKSLHVRPVGKPWYEKEPIMFDKNQVKMFQKNIEAARRLEDENFSVYGITHKFTHDFQPKNNFSKCHALFMTTVFMPPNLGDSPDSFILNQCCDRRGDLSVELGHNLTNIQSILEKWGSDLHWDIQNRINLSECPRCTYSPHNEIFEKVICADNMSIDFI